MLAACVSFICMLQVFWSSICKFVIHFDWFLMNYRKKAILCWLCIIIALKSTLAVLYFSCSTGAFLADKCLMTSFKRRFIGRWNFHVRSVRSFWYQTWFIWLYRGQSSLRSLTDTETVISFSFFLSVSLHSVTNHYSFWLVTSHTKLKPTSEVVFFLLMNQSFFFHRTQGKAFISPSRGELKGTKGVMRD